MGLASFLGSQPRQGRIRVFGGLIFESDIAGVIEFLNHVKNYGVVNLPGTGLMPAGNIGDLHVPDVGQASGNRADEIPPVICAW